MKVIIDDECRIIAYAQTGEIDGFIEVDVPDEFVDNFKPEYYKYDNGNVILNSSFKNTSTVVPKFKATSELIADLTQQMADLVIQFYNQGFYDAEKMKLFVKVGRLTSEQYQEVTGSDYVQSL
ncbi:DUF2977 domain-containing protein [Weissella cibaria]|uniref:DUF2977 domain-containing protein n=1 Tax=Weissella cibaria TaxID=137591 RepID=UPI00168114EF|nr:DUF2977 domain-containing protein [Weissella cibaria]MBD1502797.1 DUF2977 domain-containing protein [Weissella cibaria]MCG4287606.1 DUF2977 domain-containing protein [Weissella cibaria]